MVKISSDNILFWKIFPNLGLFASHLFFLWVIVSINLWPFYLGYFLIAFVQFGVVRVWRCLFIEDVYLRNNFSTIVFKDIRGTMREFRCEEIIKFKTAFGITDISISNNDKIKKLYFLVNSKENLKLIPV